MTDQVLINSLSLAPSKLWPVIVERHRVLTDYFGIKRPTIADVDRCAFQVGLSRRMFYRLIEERKQQPELRSPAGAITKRGRPINLEQEKLIADAIGRLKPGALTRDVYAETRKMSANRGISAPSVYAVTSRFRYPRERVELHARLGCRFDWIIDTSQLDFAMVESDGSSSPAYITVLVDVLSGETLAHYVRTAKSHSQDAVSFILTTLEQFGRATDGPNRLAVTSSLWPEVVPLRLLLRSRGLDATRCAPKTIRPGEALMFVFGRKLGNISLRPRPRQTFLCAARAIINRDLAEAVVSVLISKRNEDLKKLRNRACVR